MYKLITILLFSVFRVISTQAGELWNDVRFGKLQAGVRYDINMGTGFFVNRDTILTNAHVVSNCLNIAVRGAVEPQHAEVYIIDPELDLALLKTVAVNNIKVPYIRNNYNEIKQGDILFSIGYPLESSENGEYIIKQAKVINVFQDPRTKLSKIEFTDNVNHGNSGGPLLDKNSNLVGVVTAKHRYYAKKDPKITVRVAAAAVSVEDLQKFLKKYNVKFASSSSFDMYTNYAVDESARDYVVNIHCVKFLK